MGGLAWLRKKEGGRRKMEDEGWAADCRARFHLLPSVRLRSSPLGFGGAAADGGEFEGGAGGEGACGRFR